MARAQTFVGCLELKSARLYILLYNQDGIDTAEATNSIQMNKPVEALDNEKPPVTVKLLQPAQIKMCLIFLEPANLQG